MGNKFLRRLFCWTAILIIVSGFLVLPNFTKAVPLTDDEILKMIQKPQVKIEIPGLQERLTDPVNLLVTEETDEDGVISKYLNIPYIGEYLSVVYKYAIAAAIAFAIAMIINNGFKFVQSGGESGMVNEAKGRIAEIMIGLIIAITSYSLLYLINPNLVQFKNLKVKYIQTLTIVDVVGDLTFDLASDEQLTAGTPSPSATKIPLFKQGNYPNSPFGSCGTVQKQGCGPTSLAMVVKYFGHDVDPPIIAKLWADLGYRKCPPNATLANKCDGCGNYGQGGILSDKTFLAKYNLKSENMGTNKNKIIAALQAGKPLVASISGPSIFTGRAHYIVLVSLNNDGSIAVNDPNKQKYCNNGQTKCDESLRTIPTSAVPQNVIFENLKGATAFEKGS